MKQALILIVVFCFGCHNPKSENTDILQACLNKIESSDHFNYLRSGKIVLIKDSNTRNLSGLFLMKKKIPIQEVKPSDLVVYVPDMKNVLSLPIYLRLEEISNTGNEALTKLSLPNVNEVVTFKLKKVDEKWHVLYLTELVF